MGVKQFARSKSYDLFSPSKGHRLFPSFRLVILAVLFGSAFVINSNYFSLNFAITCMVNATYLEKMAGRQSINNSSITTSTHGSIPRSCDEPDSVGTQSYGGEYEWNRNIQAALLAGESMGAIWFVFAAGMMLDRFGARWLLTIAFGFLAISGLLVPFGASISWIFVLVLRCLAGVGIEASFPVVYYVVVRWFPVNELSTVTALALSGFSLSGIFVMLTSGVLCESVLKWDSIFYMVAMVTVVMGVIWVILFTDKIGNSPFISTDEATYIQRNRTQQNDGAQGGDTENTGGIPLKKMFTSGPVWALIVINFTNYYTFYFIGGFTPSYMKEILKLPPQMSGYMTALPYVAVFLGRNVCGVLSDRLVRYISTTNSIRIFSIISGLIPGILYLIVPFFDCSGQAAAIGCLVVGYFFYGFTVGGFMRSTCLVAPQFTGTIAGISTTASYLAGILAPYVTGAIIPDGTAEQWRIAFFTTGAIGIAGTIYFIIFGSGEVQPWAIANAILEGRNSVISLTLAPTEIDNRRFSVVAMVNFGLVHEMMNVDDMQLSEPDTNPNPNLGGGSVDRFPKKSSVYSIQTSNSNLVGGSVERFPKKLSVYSIEPELSAESLEVDKKSEIETSENN